MLSLWWMKIKMWLAPIGALLIAIAMAFSYRKGKKNAEDRQAIDRAESIVDKKRLDDEVQNLGHADLDERARRWLRPPSGR